MAGFRKAAITLVAALLPAWGFANDIRSAALAMADAALEKTFWQCDFGATQGSLSADAGPACEAVTEELKQRRFGGDFDRLLVWWQQNKAAEHGRLQAIQQAARRLPDSGVESF
ncbi:MAG TPA: hypothetical protein VFR86_24770 [Burkholderiaceae bacterium]|nr:hypothetical protein [Burkholderiaceae bacterium]